MKEKVKIAIYWGAGCGGCDVAILDLDDKILELIEVGEIVFWPIICDTKLEGLEKMPDGSIGISFYNGAVRNSENEHMAKLLRKKSRYLVALGSCACFGGIPSLANAVEKGEIIDKIYKENLSTENPSKVVPECKSEIKEGVLTLPQFYENVRALEDVVEVDCYMPGCAPTRNLIEMALEIVRKHVSEGVPLPERGSVIGSEKTLCDECPRERKDRKIEKIYMPHEIEADRSVCLLDQGIICLGPATRGGCGAKCLEGNQPCRGCMGPTSAVMEQGASMLSALSSILVAKGDESTLSEEEIEKLISGIKDPLGTFYSFTLGKSLLRRRYKESRRAVKEANKCSQ